MKKSDLHTKVVEGIIIRLTFDGGFKRSKIYAPKASESQRREFRRYLSSKLSEIISEVELKKRYSDDDHCNTIQRFSSDTTKRFGKILDKGSFRIGHAQKFLNLYWKLSWILKVTPLKPIHCPFDSVIIGKLRSARGIRWTRFDKIDEYKQLLNAAREVAGQNVALADWEMKKYWEIMNRDIKNKSDDDK